MDDKFIRYHSIKILAGYYASVESGRKTFEIRHDDRDYQVGDFLEMTCSGYNTLICEIIYKTTYAQQDGYCVLGFILRAERE